MNKFMVKSLLAYAILLIAGVGLVGQVNAQTTRRNSSAAARPRNILQRIRVNSDNFRATFDNALQNVRLRGSDAENINRSIDDYESALNDFDDRLQSRQESAEDVKQILDAASSISNFLRTTRLNARVQSDWTTVKTSLNELAREYNLTWNGSTITSNSPVNNYPTNKYPTNNYPNSGGISSARLTGTYRLNESRSDNPQDVADRTLNNLPINQRDSARATLEQRLETPEQLAIQQTGRQVTIASSRAPRYTFDADGVLKTETSDSGSVLRVRASLNANSLEVATSGDRGNDYNVIFEPLDNGRSLRVTRRLSTDYLPQPVVVTSVYERTAEIARLDIYEQPDNNLPNSNTNGNQYPNDNQYPNNNRRNDSYIIGNETVQATLNESISTKTANNNDRFTMTVQTPDQYRGAVIEGYISGINRSGKVTGRAALNFNFETIRLRNGQTYNFAGFVDSIRNNNGDEIKVDNEGRAQGGSQTKQTATRGAVGAGVGALIGAIAGGGKGAAIGAIIGGGAGAGSVYIEGRDDLEINSGSDVYIRATSPTNSSRNFSQK